jgi:DNA invertase Pin-like site-specific DNA recombinase
MTSIPVAILVRVSAQKQETDRQITELQTVATVKRWEVVEVVGETVSGSSQKRPGLNRIIELAEAGHIQKVLVHEVSRVARKNSIAHLFLERLDELGV